MHWTPKLAEIAVIVALGASRVGAQEQLRVALDLGYPGSWSSTEWGRIRGTIGAREAGQPAFALLSVTRSRRPGHDQRRSLRDRSHRVTKASIEISRPAQSQIPTPDTTAYPVGRENCP